MILSMRKPGDVFYHPVLGRVVVLAQTFLGTKCAVEATGERMNLLFPGNFKDAPARVDFCPFNWEQDVLDILNGDKPISGTRRIQAIKVARAYGPGFGLRDAMNYVDEIIRSKATNYVG